jgi:hypothetical protein
LDLPSSSTGRHRGISLLFPALLARIWGDNHRSFQLDFFSYRHVKMSAFRPTFRKIRICLVCLDKHWNDDRSYCPLSVDRISSEIILLSSSSLSREFTSSYWYLARHIVKFPT